MVRPSDEDPYAEPLAKLWSIRTRKEIPALQCSFVSKMVAIRDDTRPIFDRHVANFFGLQVPLVGSLEFRSEIFVRHMVRIRATYLGWANDPRFRDIAEPVKEAIPRLAKVSPVRTADFLVWMAGKQAALPTPTTSRP